MTTSNTDRTTSQRLQDDISDTIEAISIQLAPLPHPFTTPKLYLNFLFWYSVYLYSFFYSFNYTIKSGGVCNRLLVHRQKTILTRLHIDSLTDLVTNLVTDLIN